MCFASPIRRDLAVPGAHGRKATFRARSPSNAFASFVFSVPRQVSLVQNWPISARNSRPFAHSWEISSKNPQKTACEKLEKWRKVALFQGSKRQIAALWI